MKPEVVGASEVGDRLGIVVLGQDVLGSILGGRLGLVVGPRLGKILGDKLGSAEGRGLGITLG